MDVSTICDLFKWVPKGGTRYQLATALGLQYSTGYSVRELMTSCHNSEIHVPYILNPNCKHTSENYPQVVQKVVSFWCSYEAPPE